MTQQSSASAPGCRVTYLHGVALCEWSVNGREGLEHGFTLVRPRSGTSESRPKLEFDLMMRSNLRPEISPDGMGLKFLDEPGGMQLTYVQFRVCDAEGRTLPARFVAVSPRIRLSIETAGARYPIAIDPLAQQAYLKTGALDCDDSLGHSVAISGETVVVGAPGGASSAIYADGNRTENNALVWLTNRRAAASACGCSTLALRSA
ncbi:MAG: hypothetical protein ACREFG_04080 [Chthoniobacterales bacterium]